MSLKEAIPLQVHRKTDYPPMTDQLKAVFDQLLGLRKSKGQQVRKASRLRQTMDAVILDLWIAANYCENPYRAVSRNKEDYRKGTRYRKLFFKYALLMGVLDDLIELELIEQKLGFHDRRSGIGYQTRIKASDKLLNFLDFDIKKITRNPEAPEDETIIKRDASGKLLDYVDDRFIREMRAFLFKYNTRLREFYINTDNIDLRYKHDPTAITLKQIFKDDSGGRFYGCFFQTLSKLDRKKLLLEQSPVVELDYSALHPTLAYAFKGIQLIDDPYLIDGLDRRDVKKAFLVLFNCRDRQHAINTIRSFGVRNVESLVSKIEDTHSVIKDYFYNPGFGMALQNTDAWLAESIIKRLFEDDIVCLPIHDSFIVAEEHEAILRRTMIEIFFERFGVLPKVY